MHKQFAPCQFTAGRSIVQKIIHGTFACYLVSNEQKIRFGLILTGIQKDSFCKILYSTHHQNGTIPREYIF